jgi:hypothetical protein
MTAKPRIDMRRRRNCFWAGKTTSKTGAAASLVQRAGRAGQAPDSAHREAHRRGPFDHRYRGRLKYCSWRNPSEQIVCDNRCRSSMSLHPRIVPQCFVRWRDAQRARARHSRRV